SSVHVPVHWPWHSASHLPEHSASTSTLPTQYDCAAHFSVHVMLSFPGSQRSSTLPGSHVVFAAHPVSQSASALKSAWHSPRETTSAKFAVFAASLSMIALMRARAASHAPVLFLLAIASSPLKGDHVSFAPRSVAMCTQASCTALFIFSVT